MCIYHLFVFCSYRVLYPCMYLGVLLCSSFWHLQTSDPGRPHVSFSNSLYHIFFLFIFSYSWLQILYVAGFFPQNSVNIAHKADIPLIPASRRIGGNILPHYIKESRRLWWAWQGDEQVLGKQSLGLLPMYAMYILHVQKRTAVIVVGWTGATGRLCVSISFGGLPTEPRPSKYEIRYQNISFQPHCLNRPSQVLTSNCKTPGERCQYSYMPHLHPFKHGVV